MTSLALAAGLLAYTEASSAFVGYQLAPAVRAAGGLPDFRSENTGARGAP